MGDGQVLESGTHDELLAKEGAYARLVLAQKLREGKEGGKTENDDDSQQGEEDMEKAAREEIPLGRKNTGHSLASEILEQKRKAAEGSGKNKEGDDYSMLYLFKRMAPLIRDQWKNYVIGAIFACCKCLRVIAGVEIIAY